MSINFTKNIEQYTTTQKAPRSKSFTEFTSKKQLEDAGVLSAQALEFVKSIKGTFSFALHKDGRYMAITLYKVTNSERKYNFLIADLEEQAIAEVDSIKQAKAEIAQLTAEAPEDAECAPAAEPVEEPEVKPTRRRKKNDPQEENAEA